MLRTKTVERPEKITTPALRHGTGRCFSFNDRSWRSENFFIAKNVEFRPLKNHQPTAATFGAGGTTLTASLP